VTDIASPESPEEPVSRAAELHAAMVKAAEVYKLQHGFRWVPASGCGLAASRFLSHRKTGQGSLRPRVRRRTAQLFRQNPHLSRAGSLVLRLPPPVTLQLTLPRGI
jgi:hypothetical protein